MTREDVFENYSQVEFEREFGRLFSIKGSVNLVNSERTLYLMVSEA